MTPFTPEQQKAIKNWTEQRDSLLREIGIRTNEFREIQVKVMDASASLTDLELRIAEAKGRLAEIDALEERARTSVSTDIAELEVRKSRLEGECALKEAELKSADEKHVIVVSATAELSAAHDVMKDQAAIVNRVTGEIIETSKLYLSDTKIMMVEIKSISDQVIEKGNENVKQTGIVLEKLPRYIFELQKPIPVRRAYATPKGTVIRPEDPKPE
jgi:hypothetical protein